MMIYALCRKIDCVENLRVLGVKIWTGIFIRVKNLTFSMSDQIMLISLFPTPFDHFQFHGSGVDSIAVSLFTNSE